jgi:S1-C subfamily serine protease
VLERAKVKRFLARDGQMIAFAPISIRQPPRRFPRIAFWIGAAIGWLVSSLAHGQALYRVTTPEAGGVSSIGSATGISACAVVTNSHVVNHRAGLGQTVYVSGAADSLPGKVIAIDDDFDLAIVRVAGQLGAAAPLGRGPAVGQRVTFRGIASGTQTTQIIPSNGFLDPTCSKVRVLELACNAVPGDSGGGVYDDAGKLVAIAWGAYGGHAHAVAVDYLANWIRAIETNCGPLGCVMDQPPRGRLVYTPEPAPQFFTQPPTALPPQPAPPLVTIPQLAPQAEPQVILRESPQVIDTPRRPFRILIEVDR